MKLDILLSYRTHTTNKTANKKAKAERGKPLTTKEDRIIRKKITNDYFRSQRQSRNTKETRHATNKDITTKATYSSFPREVNRYHNISNADRR